MSMSSIEREDDRGYEPEPARASVEAWLRVSLGGEYGSVAAEALPGFLLELLPQD